MARLGQEARTGGFPIPRANPSSHVRVVPPIAAVGGADPPGPIGPPAGPAGTRPTCRQAGPRQVWQVISATMRSPARSQAGPRRRVLDQRDRRGRPGSCFA